MRKSPQNPIPPLLRFWAAEKAKRSVRQIETTVQSVLQDIVAMEFSYRDHLQLETDTDDTDKYRRIVVNIE